MALGPNSIFHAAEALLRARKTGIGLDRLPESARPRSAADAWAIQRVVVAELGEAIGGWKVATSAEQGVLVGCLLGSRMFADGARISAAAMPMLGVEAEIAFRFDRPLPPRESAYERMEIEAAVNAFPAIEIVDTRFKDYNGTPLLDRTADFMSNGGFVVGAARDNWRSFDLAGLEARLTIDGVEIVRRVSGHVAGDPLIPAIALVNTLRAFDGISAGQVVTTGTYTGLEVAGPDSTVEATFTDFGTVNCSFY